MVFASPLLNAALIARPSRFPSAFAVALGAHGGIALALSLVPEPTPHPAAPSQELDVELAVEAPGAPPIVPIAPSPTSSPATRSAAPATASPVRAASEVALPAPSGEPAPVASAVAPSPSARIATLDLGVGTYWKTAALGDPFGATGGDARPSAPVDRALRDGLDAHDRAVGLGPEGPIVSAAHEAASPDVAPDVGTAVFDVDCDASGRTVTVRLVSTGADRGRWLDVERELARLLAAKTVHVPPGARGVRARIEIAAERTLPAGEKRESHAGAVSDDVPGEAPSCVGSGAERRCVAGMPLGMTQTLGDLSNIGAKRSRIVHVHVLGETTF